MDLMSMATNELAIAKVSKYYNIFKMTSVSHFVFHHGRYFTRKYICHQIPCLYHKVHDFFAKPLGYCLQMQNNYVWFTFLYTWEARQICFNRYIFLFRRGVYKQHGNFYVLNARFWSLFSREPSKFATYFIFLAINIVLSCNQI